MAEQDGSCVGNELAPKFSFRKVPLATVENEAAWHLSIAELGLEYIRPCLKRVPFAMETIRALQRHNLRATDSSFLDYHSQGKARHGT